MPRIALLLVTLMASGAFQDDVEIAKWINDLGHDEVARRDAAQAQLLKIGEKALPDLKKTLESKDLERATRARALVDEIERPRREREHDALMRPRQLGLVSFELAKSKLSQVLAAIEKEGGYRFKSSFVIDPEVSLTAKEAPLRKVLDAIEDQIDASIRPNKEGVYEVSPGRFLRKPRMYLPGATLEFGARPAKAVGKVVGRRIKVSKEGTSDPKLGPWVAIGTNGKPREVELCEVCGPSLLLVRGDPEAEVRIRTRSSFVWSSLYELRITSPELTQTFKVGVFSVTYDFPKVTITSLEDVPSALFPHATLFGAFKEGKGLRMDLGFLAAGLKGNRDPETWCDCEKGPKPVVVQAPAIRRSRVDTKYRLNSPGDFDSMMVLFYKPIEEPFDGEVVISAD